MQIRRSGLAAAAAKMQLTDAPEGESSLQSRLNEAERRAQDAEASAQNARAALARTLLEAAQVEAVVTARVKAQSEAELSALRSQLDAVKAAAPQHPDAVDDSAACETAKAGSEKVAKPADAPPPAALNPTARPAAESNTDTRDDAPAALTAIADPAERLLPPDVPDAADIDAARSGVLRFLPPAPLAFLSVTAVVAVISYLVASSYMYDRADHLSAAVNAVSAIVGFAADDDRLVQGAATDSKAIADAAETLDAERLRLQSLSKKIAAMRAFVAEHIGGTPAAQPQLADRTVSADRTAPLKSRAAPVQDAGWLLYMPVEREALVSYLAGRSWPGIQLAAQEKAPPRREN